MPIIANRQQYQQSWGLEQYGFKQWGYLPRLRKSDVTSVLTVTSYSVIQPIANLVLFNSIRNATVALTKSLASELGKDGIRFTSILLAWTETEHVTELMAAHAKINNSTRVYCDPDRRKF